MSECKRCRGSRLVEVETNDLSGKRPTSGLIPLAIIACPQCCGKGNITEEDRKRYYKCFMEKCDD